VRLRLVPAAPFRVTALVGVRDADAAMACLVAARRGTPSLEAAELFFADGLDLVRSHLGLPAPFADAACGAYLLLEAAGASDPTDELLAGLDAVAGHVIDTAVATVAARRADLWRYREAHTEAINAVGVPHKLDVTLPLGGLATFCTEVRAVVASVAPDAHTYLFGHAGDGNVHVNVVGGDVPDEVDAAVLGLVARRGGSISAEHGIGTAKREFLHLVRSPAEIDAFRRLKAALDPAGILNPNVLLPAGVS
jgi:FAD/FMN-containing dehydrogenase